MRRGGLEGLIQEMILCDLEKGPGLYRGAVCVWGLRTRVGRCCGNVETMQLQAMANDQS